LSLRSGPSPLLARRSMSGGSPASGTLPETEVRAMFDRIARIYDPLNTLMTAGMHHAWRRRSADLARVGPGSRVLDVATGTGDLALELGSRGASVTGMDFSPAMLELARAKAPGIEFEEGDALDLRYDDASFDAVTVGFGARNFADLDRGLREMARVTKPGGRVVVLEITTPQRPPLSWFFRAWFDRVVPMLGKLAGDSDAYTYLPSSVRRFPAPEVLAASMTAAGLTDVRWVLTAGGIIAMHSGTRAP
jgi:demethylmenaquinone methyltransferase / 2-methoxy-6-polyprenyl-1,4-benzoquinol methylase